MEVWQIPTDYVGVAHEILARIKAASEGETWPLTPQVIERLGAPFGADWNAYPTSDKPLMLLLGAIAKLAGVFAAANIGLLLAQLTAALAFYFTARWLRCRWGVGVGWRTAFHLHVSHYSSRPAALLFRVYLDGTTGASGGVADYTKPATYVEKQGSGGLFRSGARVRCVYPV